MVINSKGKLFEERRKGDRRKNDAKTITVDNKRDKREKKDRRNTKNEYKV